jgi:hypothetical protein
MEQLASPERETARFFASKSRQLFQREVETAVNSKVAKIGERMQQDAVQMQQEAVGGNASMLA